MTDVIHEVKKETFKKICWTCSSINKKTGNVSTSVCPSIALWRLTTGDVYRVVITTLGQGKSLVIAMTTKSAEQSSTVPSTCIKFPMLREEMKKAISDFAEWNFVRSCMKLLTLDGRQFKTLAPKVMCGNARPFWIAPNRLLCYITACGLTVDWTFN